jgi:pyridoxine kinase
LTGYIGSESFLEAVIDVVTTIRKIHPTKNIRYVCDPVLGDKGKFYVPPSLVDVYKTKVLPLADVITPNQFEVEQLTGIVTHTIDDAITACQILHTMGPSLVFITSLILDSNNMSDETMSPSSPETLSILASSYHTPLVNGIDIESTSNNNNDNPRRQEIWQIDCPILPGQYTGTGDLTAALLLAHTALTSSSSSLSSLCNNEDMNSILPCAMEKVINTMFAILERTNHYSTSVSNATTITTAVAEIDTVKSRELKLIQCKDIIENPPQRFKCIKIR